MMGAAIICRHQGRLSLGHDRDSGAAIQFIIEVNVATWPLRTQFQIP